jgi:hypothetical protein
MSMLIYYTLSTIWPPRETFVAQTVESLDDELALEEQHHGLGHAQEGSGSSDPSEWEKAPGSARYNKEQAAV